MKKFLVFLFMVSLSTPAIADVINPNLTAEQMAELRLKRQEQITKRMRISNINRVCGVISTEEDKISCKEKLMQDYLETIKYIETNYGKESKIK